ncbi:M48 family metallopeptidase [Camelliibacillus cellulosilyticus]|uniref:M48 family metallopeptidase n=1 Tax=Camelliibacillus cellulosilyticus TaxID=2174486 RepID=A0ABV9GNI7_9BACL
MKKVAWWFIGIYVIYIGLMIAYFYLWTSPGVPAQYKGTVADPQTFMTPTQIVQSEDYSRIGNLIYFISLPLDWGIYLFVLIFGFSRWLKKRSEEVTRFSVVHTGIYFLALSILTWIIAFPIDYGSHMLSVHYGVSVQPFSSWLRDEVVSFWVNFIIAFLTIAVVYFFIRRNAKRWWLPVWLISIPFTLFLTYIQPVWIDPLYNKFQPLHDGELKHEILHLASKADIPAKNVYEVDMSKKTKAMNAYVNGIGANLRIVLWDTTLHDLNHREVLFIMAHEMGHYVKHHLMWSVIGSIFASLIGLFLAAKVHHWSVHRWGEKIGVRHPGDLASIPILLIILSAFSFVASPIENTVSRHAEHQADKYGVELTQDKKAGIDAFQKLTTTSLDEVNPPALVKIFIYGHPTMLERINFLENFPTHASKQKSQ